MKYKLKDLAEWLKHQTMLITQITSLTPADLKARRFLDGGMEKIFLSWFGRAQKNRRAFVKPGK